VNNERHGRSGTAASHHTDSPQTFRSAFQPPPQPLSNVRRSRQVMITGRLLHILPLIFLPAACADVFSRYAAPSVMIRPTRFVDSRADTSATSGQSHRDGEDFRLYRVAFMTPSPAPADRMTPDTRPLLPGRETPLRRCIRYRQRYRQQKPPDIFSFARLPAMSASSSAPRLIFTDYIADSQPPSR